MLFRSEVIPGGVVGVVAVAHAVEVVQLHQADILQHGGYTDGAAGVGIVFVAVDAAEEHCLSVDELHAVLHLHGAESEAVDRKSTRLNSSHKLTLISYAVFCLDRKSVV